LKNGKFNTYPTRLPVRVRTQTGVARDQAKAVAAGMPFWWTAADEVDRNAARRGCQDQDRDCIECSVSCCPEARRTCRVCASWESGTGECGKCERNRFMVGRDQTCEKWRARG
jgi:hypothetical protein